MAAYPDDMPVREALERYFAQYHFKDGGYRDKWFHIKLGPLMIPLPNIPARVEAVKIHDLHHIITGYTAHWKGEVEIAGWELGGGCGRYWVAWLLNLGSFSVGLFLFPRALFRAWHAGRSVQNNLYHDVVYDDALLNSRLGDLRRRITQR